MNDWGNDRVDFDGANSDRYLQQTQFYKLSTIFMKIINSGFEYRLDLKNEKNMRIIMKERELWCVTRIIVIKKT